MICSLENKTNIARHTISDYFQELIYNQFDYNTKEVISLNEIIHTNEDLDFSAGVVFSNHMYTNIATDQQKILNMTSNTEFRTVN